MRLVTVVFQASIVVVPFRQHLPCISSVYHEFRVAQQERAIFVILP